MLDDMFNEVESQLNTLLSADEDISDLVNYFHVKLKGDIEKYRKTELPACATHFTGYSDNGEGKFIELRGLIEVVHHGGDISVIDDEVKQIVSLIIQKLLNENPEDGYGAGLSNKVDVIYVDNAEIIPPFPGYQRTKGFFEIAHLDIKVEIYGRQKGVGAGGVVPP
jgi:hypothetical protein